MSGRETTAGASIFDQVRQFEHWPALTMAGVVAIFLACISLWHVESLRPFLATAGAGVAAFAGQLPGLLSPTMRGKWLFAIAISTMITAGVWVATKNLEDQLEDSRLRIERANTRFTAEAASIQSIVNRLSAASQNDFFLQSGRYYRGLWRAQQFQAILDMALPALEVNPDNGHALYYAGEVYREFGNRVQMRSLFEKFIAASEENPDARTGAAAACYQRPAGFCQERLGWIYHLMSHDYLLSSERMVGDARIEALRTAFQYERLDIELRRTVFFDNGTAPASCDILLSIARDLAGLHRSDADVRAFGRDGPGRCANL